MVVWDDDVYVPYPVAIICCLALDGWFTADGQPDVPCAGLRGETSVGAAGAMNDVLVYVDFRADGELAADDTAATATMRMAMADRDVDIMVMTGLSDE